MEVVADRRKRDVDDRDVEHHDEDRGADNDERLPAAGIGCDGVHSVSNATLTIHRLGRMASLAALETDRLLLRPLSAEDLDALAGFVADPETMRYIGAGDVRNREQARETLERMIDTYEAQGFGQLGVVRKEDGAFMGRCGLLVWDPTDWTITRLPDAEGPVEIEVGYLLGRDYWGAGYATEAASAVRDWALANLELERLIALIQPGNDRSARVAHKLGMEPGTEIEIFDKRAVVYALAGNLPAR